MWLCLPVGVLENQKPANVLWSWHPQSFYVVFFQYVIILFLLGVNIHAARARKCMGRKERKRSTGH